MKHQGIFINMFKGKYYACIRNKYITSNSLRGIKLLITKTKKL